MSLNRLLIKLTALSTFPLFLFSGQLAAQKAWTLKECIDHAIEHNLTIQQTDITTQQSELGVTRSKAAFLPNLNASGSHQYNFGRSVDPFSYTFTNEEIRSTNFSLNGNVTIFNGFQLQNSLKQSQLEYLASQNDLKKIQNDISLNVVSAYMQVLYAKEQLKVTDARLSESGQQRARTRRMVEAGIMTQGNLLDAESQYATEELNQVTAQNQLAIAKLNLIQLLEVDSMQGFDIADPQAFSPEITTLSQSPEEIYALAIKFLPEIKSADTRILSAEKSLAVSRGAFLPRLSMFGGLNTGYSSTRQELAGITYGGFLPNGSVTAGGDIVFAPVYISTFRKTSFSDQLDQNFSKNFGFSLSIPIFNGLNTNLNVRSQRLALENAKVTSDLSRNQLFKSIQQAHTDALSAQKKLAATEKSVQALQEAYTYAEKRFNAGLSPSLEFLTATNNLTRARIDNLQAKYDLLFRVKVLDFYAGRPLTF
jgi:outer membrane protein